MTVSIADLHKLRSAIIENKCEASLVKLQQFALSNIPYAQYLLGEMYYYGEGVEVNHDEATKWLCLATDAECPEAMFTLAYFVDPQCTFANAVLDSKRILKSHKIADFLRKTAFNIFVERAENGDAYVAKWIASCYEMGWGVEHDLEKCREWEQKNPSDPYPTL